jgi:hypothetical protein
MSPQRFLFRADSASRKSVTLWFERLMAVTVLVNFGLILFDWSYIPWRDFYLRQLPGLTQWYGDRVKGIEPHRATEIYLNTVDRLEQELQQGTVAPSTLASLRSQSAELVDENPFQSANKSGTLERIKKRMRQSTQKDSSKDAFNAFWTAPFSPTKLTFFNQRIRPLIATNYYRGVSENGDPIDLFWQIDLGFIALFGLEFLARTYTLSRRYRLPWRDTMVWRWYDLLLLLPFWRWLRLIPVGVRLNESKLLNLNPIRDRIVRSFIATFAIELTEMVVLRILDQVQDLIRAGEALRLLQQNRRYIDLNGVDERAEIAKRLTHVVIYQVLPKVKPDLEALLRHSVDKGLSLSPVYAGAKNLPGFGFISAQVTQQLVADITQNTYQALIAALEDEAGGKLVQSMVSHFAEAFQAEFKQDQLVDEIQTLMVDLIEEIKVNYANQLSSVNGDDLKLKTNQIYQLTQVKK